MRIGIVGLGVVGGASAFGFRKLGHEVFVHDTKLDTKLSDVLRTQVTFVAVPTPCNHDGTCDTSIVEKVVGDLYELKYEGIIGIRSTICPGTTAKLIVRHPDLRICFIPEFLRERCAISDFVEHHNLLAVGTIDMDVYTMIKFCFGHYPKAHAQLTPTEAELLKYYHNLFGALRVVFANEFYEMCQKLGGNYTSVKNAVLQSSKLPDIYLDVNDDMRGYSSICWNKDLPALCALAKTLNLELPLIYTIEPSNDRFKKTPFDGTREHY